MKYFKTVLIVLSALFLLSSKPHVGKSITYNEIAIVSGIVKYSGLSDSDIYDLMLYNRVQNFIKEELLDFPNHYLRKNDVERFRIAKIIVDSANKVTHVNWEHLFAIIRYESSFNHKVIAEDKPSQGLTQLHGAAWVYCSDVLSRKTFRDSIEDQVLCGGLWLNHSIELCHGNIDQGLARYATGYMCDYSDSKSVQFIVGRRMKLINKLNK